MSGAAAQGEVGRGHRGYVGYSSHSNSKGGGGGVGNIIIFLKLYDNFLSAQSNMCKTTMYSNNLTLKF